MIVIMTTGARSEISFPILILRNWIPLPHSPPLQHYCFINAKISCSVHYSPDLNYWRLRSSALKP